MGGSCPPPLKQSSEKGGAQTRHSCSQTIRFLNKELDHHSINLFFLLRGVRVGVGWVGAQVGGGLVLSSRWNARSHPGCAPPSRWYQWKPGFQDETRADKQASPPAWQGLKHLQSYRPSFFPHLFISVPSLLPISTLKAKTHTTTLAQHGHPLPRSSLPAACRRSRVPATPHPHLAMPLNISQRRLLPLAGPRERAAAHTH